MVTRNRGRKRDVVFGVINMVLGTVVISLGWGPDNAVLGVPAPIGGMIVFLIGVYVTLKGRGILGGRDRPEHERRSPHGGTGAARVGRHVTTPPGRKSDVVFGGLTVVIGLFLIVSGWTSDYSRFGLSAPALGAVALLGGSYFVLKGLGRIGGSS